MTFIKPKDWITPAGQAAMDDCCPPLAFVTRAFQAATYPVAAAISGIGAISSKIRKSGNS